MNDSEKVYRFDDVLVEASAFRVSRAGEVLALEPKAVDVLLFLIERTGQLVSKQELLDRVWKDVAVTDNALTRVVAQLRRALGDEAKRARYIETVPTRGYRFVATVERVAAVALQPSSKPSAGTATPAVERAPGSIWRRRPVAIAGLAAAVVAAWAASWIWTGARSDAPARLRPTGPPVQLTSSTGLDLFPAASPDGSTIAFASD